VSKLIEGLVINEGKAILIDATGEYYKHDTESYSVDASILATKSFFHYSNLTIGDLFVLLRPAGQVQAPKLMEAIKSLKVLKILNEKVDADFIKIKDENTFAIKIKQDIYEDIKHDNGTLLKAGQLMRPFNRVYDKYIQEIESFDSDFNVKALSNQIVKECVYDVDFNSSNKWGGQNANHLNNCISLILRINNLINNPQFENIFGFNKTKTDENELINQIEKFLEKEESLLRIGFEDVGFDFQAREILANAIGKYLLEAARKGRFKKIPLVLFVDEAHQYLNKEVKDEYFELTKLNSFNSIAKECRKYGLFLCLATQMPRDIPIGTLSQIGTFIVHRLINHFDKESIANASSSANKSSLDFLPILGAGEAILMGVDFPMPVMMKLYKPIIEPDSSTPSFIKPKAQSHVF